jgi:hypothetical protein
VHTNRRTSNGLRDSADGRSVAPSFNIRDVSKAHLDATLPHMTLNRRILYHQVHPAKLATDILTSVVSLYFFWQHELAPALLTHIIPPIVASAALIGSGKNFASIQRSSLGRYLDRYMTPAAQLTRLFGDIVTVFAAWWHSLLGIAVGLLIVIGAWSFGLVFRAPYLLIADASRRNSGN